MPAIGAISLFLHHNIVIYVFPKGSAVWVALNLFFCQTSAHCPPAILIITFTGTMMAAMAGRIDRVGCQLYPAANTTRLIRHRRRGFLYEPCHPGQCQPAHQCGNEHVSSYKAGPRACPVPSQNVLIHLSMIVCLTALCDNGIGCKGDCSRWKVYLSSASAILDRRFGAAAVMTSSPPKLMVLKLSASSGIDGCPPDSSTMPAGVSRRGNTT